MAMKRLSLFLFSLFLLPNSVHATKLQCTEIIGNTRNYISFDRTEPRLDYTSLEDNQLVNNTVIYSKTRVCGRARDEKTDRCRHLVTENKKAGTLRFSFDCTLKDGAEITGEANFRRDKSVDVLCQHHNADRSDYFYSKSCVKQM